LKELLKRRDGLKKKVLYKTLKVDQKATPEQIKAAYRKQAKNHHPDQGGNSHLFSEINQAYKVLISPEARAAYDKTGKTNFNEPDIRFSAAMDRVAQLIFDAMKHCDFRHEDIVKICINQIDKQKIEFQSNIKKIKKEKAALLSYLKKFNIKDKRTPDHIKAIIEGQINNSDLVIETIRKKIEIIDMARNIFLDYNYNYSVRNEAHFVFDGPTSTTTYSGPVY